MQVQCLKKEYNIVEEEGLESEVGGFVLLREVFLL